MKVESEEEKIKDLCRYVEFNNLNKKESKISKIQAWIKSFRSFVEQSEKQVSSDIMNMPFSMELQKY